MARPFYLGRSRYPRCGLNGRWSRDHHGPQAQQRSDYQRPAELGQRRLASPGAVANQVSIGHVEREISALLALRNLNTPLDDGQGQGCAAWWVLPAPAV